MFNRSLCLFPKANYRCEPLCARRRCYIAWFAVCSPGLGSRAAHGRLPSARTRNHRMGVCDGRSLGLAAYREVCTGSGLAHQRLQRATSREHDVSFCSGEPCKRPAADRDRDTQTSLGPAVPCLATGGPLSKWFGMYYCVIYVMKWYT